MKTNSYYLLSLGCAKNTVDSESMAAMLANAGFSAAAKPSKAGVLIVNTCGFIKPAIEESIQSLRDLARRKRPGQLLIAAGCLSQRFSQLVADQVPGIDGILGTRRWMDIVDLVQKLRAERPSGPLYHLPEAPTVGQDEHGVARVAVQGGSSYIKIADGCRRPCAFCSIPLIKGTAVSRPTESILNEARLLSDSGVKELILIAQDTTDYGHDLGIKDGLAYLLEKIVAEVPEMPWIRLLYAYPGYVTDRLVQVMADSPQILSYLDMPLQHAHPMTLRRMRRPANMDWVHRTLHKMRSAMPDLALRTTFIVGYPGETEEEFQVLLDFIHEIEFDHLGAFTFFSEAGTESESLGDTVPKEVKDERLERLMLAQQKISLARNQRFLGKILPVLIEGCNDGISVGRSYRDAPEVDGLVFAEGEAQVGEIIPVKITGGMTYELTGVIV
jgi:ribosomal protein S12 methylthiotransferase